MASTAPQRSPDQQVKTARRTVITTNIFTVLGTVITGAGLAMALSQRTGDSTVITAVTEIVLIILLAAVWLMLRHDTASLSPQTRAMAPLAAPYTPVAQSPLILGLAVVLVIYPATQFLAAAAEHLIGSPGFAAVVESRSHTATENPVLLLFTVLLIAPVFEELLVRGTLYPLVRAFTAPTRAGAWITVITTAVVFAALHGNIVQFTLALPLGIMLGLVYETTGSLLGVIGLHCLYNISTLLMPRTVFTETVASTAPALSIAASLLLCLLIAVVCRYIMRNTAMIPGSVEPSEIKAVLKSTKPSVPSTDTRRVS